jgi:hypothetical protein
MAHRWRCKECGVRRKWWSPRHWNKPVTGEHPMDGQRWFCPEHKEAERVFLEKSRQQHVIYRENLRRSMDQMIPKPYGSKTAPAKTVGEFTSEALKGLARAKAIGISSESDFGEFITGSRMTKDVRMKCEAVLALGELFELYSKFEADVKRGRENHYQGMMISFFAPLGSPSEDVPAGGALSQMRIACLKALLGMLSRSGFFGRDSLQSMVHEKPYLRESVKKALEDQDAEVLSTASQVLAQLG